MRGISLLILAVAGASASPALDNVKRGFYRPNLLNARSDTPTETTTTSTEEPQPTTTTTAEVETVPSERPQQTCDGEDGADCSTSTSSYIQGGPPPGFTGECSGTSTYAGSTPPTVFSTVTETYTVSEKDVQMADDPSIITPPPPCSATIIPGWSFPMDDFTSTVLVTKKTAVPYSEPTDPPSFTDPPDREPETTEPPNSDNNGDGDEDCEDGQEVMCNLDPPEDSPDSPDGGCSSSDSDCDSTSDEASSSSGNAPSESASGSPPNTNPNESSDNEDEKTDNDNDKDDTISQMTISGVPIVLSPSKIQIGGQFITDFRDSPTPTTLVANGKTFTVNKSEVIGPKTTIPIPSGKSNTGPDSNSDSDEDTLSPFTVGDLTFSIGPSEAIISGTTLTIGPDSTPTTTVMDGKTISVGPDGLGFPSTTIEPPTAPPTSTATGKAAANLSTSNILSSIAALLPFLGAWGFI